MSASKKDKEKDKKNLWKTKEYHWYLMHGQRDRIWHPKLGFVDTKQYGAFTTFSEMHYSECYPDERGGGMIEPQKLTVQFQP